MPNNGTKKAKILTYGRNYWKGGINGLIYMLPKNPLSPFGIGQLAPERKIWTFVGIIWSSKIQRQHEELFSADFKPCFVLHLEFPINWWSCLFEPELTFCRPPSGISWNIYTLPWKVVQKMRKKDGWKVKDGTGLEFSPFEPNMF
jgi:hypothetical protein